MTCILIWGENWEVGDRGGEGGTHSPKASAELWLVRPKGSFTLQTAPSASSFNLDFIKKKNNNNNEIKRQKTLRNSRCFPAVETSQPTRQKGCKFAQPTRCYTTYSTGSIPSEPTGRRRGSPPQRPPSPRHAVFLPVPKALGARRHTSVRGLYASLTRGAPDRSCQLTSPAAQHRRLVRLHNSL